MKNVIGGLDAAVVEPVKARVLLSGTLQAANPGPLPTNGLTGEYFSGSNFQTPVLVRYDPTVNFAYANGVPEHSIPSGAYSVKWTGQVEPLYSETYTFAVRTNGGIQVSVNGQMLINDLTPHPMATSSGTIALQAGQKYSIAVEYVQTSSTGPSGIHLRWSSPSQQLQIIPKSRLFSDQTVVLPGGAGLTGEYFFGEHFKNPVLFRQDPTVNFNWGGGTPDAGIGHSPFSVIWTGQVTAKYTEPYTFYTNADDGTQLLINGQLVIDDFREHVSTLRASQPINLVAGQSYSVVLRYFENNVPPASVKFLWSSPSTPLQIVPASALSSVNSTTPQNVAATGASATSILVSWSTVPTATSYIVERSTTPDGSSGFTTVGTTSSTSLTDTGLAAGTYYYRITAVTPTGNSTPSNLVSGMTSAAAINLTTTAASDTQINLTWNDVPNETGFIIQSSPDGSTNWTQLATVGQGVTMYSVAGLTASTLYHYRIIAILPTGNSAPSNSSSATTNAPIPTYASLTTIYGLTTTSNLVYSINTTTGAATQIGSLAFGTSAAGRDPVTGNFYYISTGSSTINIATWNPSAPAASANTTVATNIPVTGVVTRAAFRDDGLLFYTDSNGNLATFNTKTNTATNIGAIQVGGSGLPTNNGDMAFAPDGTLFVETDNQLYSITPSALAAATNSSSVIPATLVGSTGTQPLQIAFGNGGALYGYDPNGQIYTVDTSTGTATAVPGSTPSGVAMGDLASVPLYADLSITQTASTFTSGQNGTYTFTIANAGPDATVAPTTVTDTLPAGVTFVSGSGNGWTFSSSGQTVTMQYGGNIAKNATVPSAVLTVSISSSAKPSAANTVTVGSTVFDTNTANNTSMLSTPVS